MAVCRPGPDSDVYVVYSVGGGIECRECALHKESGFNAPDEAAMISHLNATTITTGTMGTMYV